MTMGRKFVIATVVVALAFVALGRFGTSPSGRGDGGLTAGPSAAEAIDPIRGARPLEEIIQFWESRAAAGPLDYLSRTELGLTRHAAAAETGDTDLYLAAEEVFREAIDLNPRHIPARLGLASTLIARHDFAGALVESEVALESDPTSPPALALRGDALIGIGRTSEAIDAVEQLVARERSAPTVARLARLRSTQGLPDEALDLATEALLLSDELALRPTGSAFYRFQVGHFAFAAGRVDEAIEAYRSALAEDPTHLGAAEGLAFALGSAGRFDEAAAVYEELLARSPAADLHGLYAANLTALGNVEAADAALAAGDRMAAEGLDGDPAERRHLAGYLTDRDPVKAIAVAEADLVDRQDAGAYDTLAWALYRAGKYDEASEAIRAALDGGTADARIKFHGAAIADAVGDGAVARRLLAEALERNPRFHPTEADEAAELAERLALKS